MKKGVKIAAAGLAAVLSASVSASLSGCGLLRDPVEISEHMQAVIESIDFDADESYEGTLRIWAQSKDTERAIIDKFIGSFEEKYTNIDVVLETFAPDAYITTIKNKNSAAYSNNDFSQVADVMWVTNETIPSLVTMDMLMPVNFIDDADEAFSTDGLVESMVEDSEFNGNLYMMPRDYNQYVLYYNKWFFDAYPSLEMPDQTRAMQAGEFWELMDELHNLMSKQAKSTPAGTTTMAGQVLDVNWNWGSMAYGMFRMFGGGVTDGEGNLIFDSEENYNAIDWIKRAVAAGYAPLADAQSLGTEFKWFRAPFLIETRANFTDIVNNATVNVPLNDYIGVMPLPVLDTEENYSIGSGCSGYAMNYNAQNATEAWLFLKHVVSEEGQNAFGETGNAVPVLKSLLTDENAAWRNLGDYGISLSGDFNHDAFIYKYDTNSCTMVDFKSKIPAGAVGNVANYMLNAMKSGINNTPAENYADAVKSILERQEQYMQAAIDRAGE